MTKDYMGVQEWAAAAGFPYTQVRNWVIRFGCPEPDVSIGGKYLGWDRDRQRELTAWCREIHAGIDQRYVHVRDGGDLVRPIHAR